MAATVSEIDIKVAGIDNSNRTQSHPVFWAQETTRSRQGLLPVHTKLYRTAELHYSVKESKDLFMILMVKKDEIFKIESR